MEVRDIIAKGRPSVSVAHLPKFRYIWGVHDGYEYALEEFENNRLKACDNLTPEEAERESAFVVPFVKEHHRAPTFSDAIEETRKQMIDKAERVINNVLGGYIIREFHFGNLYSIDKLAKDIRKAMEE